MSEIMYAKIKDACGNNKQLKDLYMVDVHEATMDVFRKLDYHPSKNIDKSVDKAWANANRDDYLFDFIFEVWRNDS